MPTPPPLSREERLENLRIACAARKKRLDIKKKLADGYITLFEVIELGKKDDAIGRMSPLDLLKCIPGIGRTTAERIIREANIAPTRRIKGLGKYQIAILVDATRYY